MMHLVTGTEIRVETDEKMAPLQGLAGWLWEAARHLIGVGPAGRPRPMKQMRVVETLAIGAKKQLVLVSVGGERFLVGTGPESVQTIVRVRPESGVAIAGGGGPVVPKVFGDSC